MSRPVRPHCSRCGERKDFFVRISSLATLIRDASSAEGLGIDISEKTPADYEWIAFHCGRCGHEGPRQDFEATPVTDQAGMDRPPDAVREALHGFIETIEAAGGCVRNEGDTVAPAGDLDWLDLADAYLRACRAMGREPRIHDQDADEILADDEGTADG
ncbi:MAG: hypothetical protein ACLQGP_35780 [Isosphaeraceae bacterium]